MDNLAPANIPSTDKADSLGKLGLYWTVIGFLILLEGLFGANIVLILAAIILLLLTSPGTKPHANKLRTVAVYAGYLVLFFFVLIGTIWMSLWLHMDANMVASAVCIAIGIFLQVWSNMRQQSKAGGNMLALLISKIKQL